MKPSSNFATGIKFGIAAGIIYILMLTLRYMFCDGNPFIFGIAATFSYIIFIILLIIAANFRKKELGGYADTRQLFQTIFMVILIAEICYSLFTYIYLTFIDPSFLERFVQNTEIWIEKIKMPEEQAEKMREQLAGQKKSGIGTILLGFCQALVIDSIVGLIIAFIMKKKKPLSDFDNINP
jgi:hypothetical protein